MKRIENALLDQVMTPPLAPSGSYGQKLRFLQRACVFPGALGPSRASRAGGTGLPNGGQGLSGGAGTAKEGAGLCA